MIGLGVSAFVSLWILDYYVKLQMTHDVEEDKIKKAAKIKTER